MDAVNIGARIQTIIDDRDISQTTLAARLGVRANTLNGYINGHHRFPQDLIASIANTLNISADYIFGLTDIPDPPMQLSHTERKLVESFRSLTREQRELIVKTMLIMQEQNKK